MAQCPYFPEDPQFEIKCDYLIGKEAGFKAGYVREYCKGRFKDCRYYFHLSKWMERIEDAMEEDEEA